VIDLHLHILPGVDDGPATLDDAVALAQAAAAAGTRTVVATSHVSDRYPNRAAGLAEARARLQEELAARDVALEVLPGAEIAIPQIADLAEDELRALALGGADALLVEAPLSPAVSDVEPVLRGLLARGHRVVLAHPERSPLFLTQRSLLTMLVAEGVLTSITASSITGRFGRTVARFARELLDHGLVHDIASDAHDLAGRRPEVLPVLAEAEALLPGLGEQVSWLTGEAPRAILAGERLPPPPPPLPPREPERRGLLARLRSARRR